MVNIELIFDISNMFFLIGTILLIISVVKNRNVLRGFQPIGSLLTLLAMSFVEFNYYQMTMWKSFCLSLPTVLFWVLTTTFSIRNAILGWLRNRK